MRQISRRLASSFYSAPALIAMLFMLVSIANAAVTVPTRCYAKVKSGFSCPNSITVSDDKAKYSNKKTVWGYVPDAYNVRFDSVNMKPTVTYGDPVYQNFWITDRYTGKYVYVNSDYNNKLMARYPNGVTFSTRSTNTGYHPPYYPNTTLETRTATGAACWSLCTLGQQVVEVRLQ
jgi:hypothetical protein